MDYYISKYLLFSPKTEVSFNSCRVELSFQDKPGRTDYVFPASIDIMTHFQYKTGNGKVQLYFLAGPDVKFRLSTNSKTNTGYKNSADLAIDFGIGFNEKIRYFIFAPELRYSPGLLNINKDPALQNLNFNKISLILNFK